MPVNLVYMHDKSFPSPKGFLPSIAEWQMSYVVQKLNDQLQKEFLLKRKTNWRQSQQKMFLEADWPAEKRMSLYGCLLCLF